MLKNNANVYSIDIVLIGNLKIKWKMIEINLNNTHENILQKYIVMASIFNFFF